MKKILLVAMFSVICFCSYGEEINRVVAKVNADIITAKDLHDYLNMIRYQSQHGATITSMDPKSPDFEKQAIDKMIEEKLIMMAARYEQNKREEAAKKDEKNASKIKLEAPASFVEKRFNEAASEFPDRAAFEKSLAENGLNNVLFRDRIRDQWLMQAIVEIDVSSYISVAPQEILEFYKKHTSGLYAPAKYQMYIGRFMDKKDWDNFRKVLLAKGITAAQTEFSHIVKATDASEASLKPEFAAPLRAAKEKTHFTVSIDEDKYFIYLIKRIPPRQLGYKYAEAKIANFLWTKKFRKRFKLWITALRKQAVIRTYL